MAFDYNRLMQRGRPTKSTRTDFGSRIHQLRVNAGLSQQEVADFLDGRHRLVSTEGVLTETKTLTRTGVVDNPGYS